MLRKTYSSWVRWKAHGRIMSRSPELFRDTLLTLIEDQESDTPARTIAHLFDTYKGDELHTRLKLIWLSNMICAIPEAKQAVKWLNKIAMPVVLSIAADPEIEKVERAYGIVHTNWFADPPEDPKDRTRAVLDMLDAFTTTSRENLDAHLTLIEDRMDIPVALDWDSFRETLSHTGSPALVYELFGLRKRGIS